MRNKSFVALLALTLLAGGSSALACGPDSTCEECKKSGKECSPDKTKTKAKSNKEKTTKATAKESK